MQNTATINIWAWKLKLLRKETLPQMHIILSRKDFVVCYLEDRLNSFLDSYCCHNSQGY